MEISFKPKEVTILDPQDMDTDKCNVRISCCSVDGALSPTAIISIQNYDDEGGFIMIDINKNQAIYMANFLLSFANEIDIDTNAEV
jgi:hypothetical protein